MDLWGSAAAAVKIPMNPWRHIPRASARPPRARPSRPAPDRRRVLVPAVCVCVSPSLSQQEPYSVPLLGNKWREPMLWIDAMKRCCGSMVWADAVGRVQPPRRGNLDSGAILPRAVCVWFIGADKCDRRPAPPAPNRLCVSVCPLL